MTQSNNATPATGALTHVVIVNYNAGDLLVRSVSAALGSTAPVRVTVVDNASADSSLASLRGAHGGDQRLDIVENSANLGFAAANNIPLAAPKGDFVLLLNPDCVVAPDTVARMLDVMHANPSAGMAGPLIRNEDGSEQVGCRRNIPTLKTAFLRAFGLSRLFGIADFNQAGAPLPSAPAPVEAISGAFMFVRRSAMDKVGLLDDGYFLHCEDLDWCLRFTQAGYQVLFVPSVEVVHHKGACGLSIPVTVELHKSRGMTRFFRKFQGGGPLYWFVAAGVWVRFAFFALLAYLRRGPGR